MNASPSVVETNKVIRRMLRDAFPGVKFRLTAGRGTGYGYCDLRWTDGPTEREVAKITELFRTANFDGMTDSMDYQKPTMPSGIYWVSLFRRDSSRQPQSPFGRNEGYICPSP